MTLPGSHLNVNVNAKRIWQEFDVTTILSSDIRKWVEQSWTAAKFVANFVMSTFVFVLLCGKLTAIRFDHWMVRLSKVTSSQPWWAANCSLLQLWWWDRCLKRPSKGQFLVGRSLEVLTRLTVYNSHCRGIKTVFFYRTSRFPSPWLSCDHCTTDYKPAFLAQQGAVD